jgi:hypothetical protein
MRERDSWTTYRTRFLVKAKQLTASLTFTDALGRQHSGRKGDYLVEFSDGVLRIATRQIFEDIYVPIVADQPQLPSSSRTAQNTPALESQEAVPNHAPLLKQNRNRLAGDPASLDFPVHLARKTQQPYRGGQPFRWA